MNLSKLYVDIVATFNESRTDLCEKLAKMVYEVFPKVEEGGFIVIDGNRILFTFYAYRDGNVVTVYLGGDPNRDDIVLRADDVCLSAAMNNEFCDERYIRWY